MGVLCRTIMPRENRHRRFTPTRARMMAVIGFAGSPVDVAEPPVAQPGGEGGADFGGVDDRGCLGWPHGEQQDGGGCDAEAHADATID